MSSALPFKATTQEEIVTEKVTELGINGTLFCQLRLVRQLIQQQENNPTFSIYFSPIDSADPQL